MEAPGLDPEITICKIAVLPIKLCPLLFVLIWVYLFYLLAFNISIL